MRPLDEALVRAMGEHPTLHKVGIGAVHRDAGRAMWCHDQRQEHCEGTSRAVVMRRHQDDVAASYWNVVELKEPRHVKPLL